jgi:hypothetical protein
MRRFDKNYKMRQANLLTEQRYLEYKGLIKESFHDVDGKPIGVDRNHMPIQGVNEISPETFKSAINVSKERGTDNRTANLGALYFNKFKGKPLLGGVIQNIAVFSPNQGNFTNVNIHVVTGINAELRNYYIDYSVDRDNFEMPDAPIERKDAVTLSRIAQHINPETKYKETTKYFKIKGY